VDRRLILNADQELKALTQQVAQAAPAYRPRGMGALSLEEINREVLDYNRFRNRKAAGSYAGLVGGVSDSGDQHSDLPITKAGNIRLRTLLIELAWRMVFYQSQSKLIQNWKHVLLNPKAHRRARKRAIVAVARQLLVDIWRWQSGRVTPAQLGWVMVSDEPEPVAVTE
jgi:transposase